MEVAARSRRRYRIAGRPPGCRSGGRPARAPRSRTAGLAQQRTAGTAAGQAVAIATIAGAYRTAAARVAAIPGSPAALHTLLAEPLHDTCSARSATLAQRP
jgi:hypothetical protein